MYGELILLVIFREYRILKFAGKSVTYHCTCQNSLSPGLRKSSRNLLTIEKTIRIINAPINAY